MQTISFTELRTKSPQLVKAIKSGQTVKLTYRDRLLADIEPLRRVQKAKKFNYKNFQRLLKEFKYPRLTVKQARKRYENHLMEKYGKYLS